MKLSRAVKKIIQDNKNGKIDINEINKETFNNYLYTSECLIRIY